MNTSKLGTKSSEPSHNKEHLQTTRALNKPVFKTHTCERTISIKKKTHDEKESTTQTETVRLHEISVYGVEQPIDGKIKQLQDSLNKKEEVALDYLKTCTKPLTDEEVDNNSQLIHEMAKIQCDITILRLNGGYRHYVGMRNDLRAQMFLKHSSLLHLNPYSQQKSLNPFYTQLIKLCSLTPPEITASDHLKFVHENLVDLLKKTRILNRNLFEVFTIESKRDISEASIYTPVFLPRLEDIKIKNKRIKTCKPVKFPKNYLDPLVNEEHLWHHHGWSKDTCHIQSGNLSWKRCMGEHPYMEVPIPAEVRERE